MFETVIVTNPLRTKVVAEAATWVGTPYHHYARVKGAGVDCLTLLAEVYERAGVTSHIEVPFYPPDWNLHRDEERYVDGVLKYTREYAIPDDKLEPEMADIVLYKFGRTYSHGVIITNWPFGIQAWIGNGVLPIDTRRLTAQDGKQRAARYFDPF